MTALVTGGTGFIGAHVVRALVAAGRRVRCLVRPSSDLRNLAGLDVDYAIGDLTDVESVRLAMSGCDVVFHGAADYRLFARNPRDLYRNNVDGTRNVLTAAAEARVQRVVYTSSVATLATSHDGAAVDETAAATTSLDDMVGDYKRSKFLAEREVVA